MGVLHPRHGPNPVHRVHRIGAASIGAFLAVFAAVGFAAVGSGRGTDFMSTDGAMALGLSTNGLLSTVSLIVGIVLVGAAVRGGPASSTVSVILGVLFLISGLANFLVLSTSMNLLAFRLSNVIFSIGVGFVLLVLGAYGRISGRLPDDSPYAADARSVAQTPAESPPAQGREVARAASELAAAERTQASRQANPELSRRLRLVGQHRSDDDRRRAWVASATQHDGPN